MRDARLRDPGCERARGSATETKSPRQRLGIAINGADTRAYVFNFISRDVSVVELTKTPPIVIAGIGSTALPPAGSMEATILRGHELFDTSIGHARLDNTRLAGAGNVVLLL